MSVQELQELVMIKFTEGLGTRGRVWLIYGKKAAAKRDGGLNDEEGGGRAKRRFERRRRQQSGTEA